MYISIHRICMILWSSLSEYWNWFIQIFNILKILPLILCQQQILTNYWKWYQFIQYLSMSSITRKSYYLILEIHSYCFTCRNILKAGKSNSHQRKHEFATLEIASFHWLFPLLNAWATIETQLYIWLNIFRFSVTYDKHEWNQRWFFHTGETDCQERIKSIECMSYRLNRIECLFELTVNIIIWEKLY